MSYDISLVINTGIEEKEVVEVGNYTYNCGPMFFEATGQTLSSLDGLHSKEAQALLLMALSNMKADPEKYRALNPKNGWGDYDSFLRYLEKFKDACEQNPLCKISIN